MKKKLLALFLAVVMVVTMLPVTALAQPAEDENDGAPAVEAMGTDSQEAPAEGVDAALPGEGDAQAPDGAGEEAQPAEEESAAAFEEDEEPSALGMPELEPLGTAEPKLLWEEGYWDDGNNCFVPNQEPVEALELRIRNTVSGRFLYDDGQGNENSVTPVRYQNLVQDFPGSDEEGAIYFLANQERQRNNGEYVELWAVQGGTDTLSYNGASFTVNTTPCEVDFFRHPEYSVEGVLAVWPYSDFEPSHTIYMVVASDSDLTISKVENICASDLKITPVAGKEGKAFKIEMQKLDFTRDTMYEIGVRFTDGSDGKEYDYWLQIDDQRDGLVWAFAHEDEQGHYQLDNGDPNRYPYIYYGGKYLGQFIDCRWDDETHSEVRTVLALKDLAWQHDELEITDAGDGFVWVEPKMASDEHNGKLLHVWQKAGSDDDAKVGIIAALPIPGFYKDTKASTLNLLTEWNYESADSFCYLVVGDDFVLDTVRILDDGSVGDSIISENSNAISYKVLGDGHAAKITLKDFSEDQLELRFWGTYLQRDGDGEIYDQWPEEGRAQIDIVNARPALMAYGVDWYHDDQGNPHYSHVDNEQYFMFDGAPGNMMTLQFAYYDGARTTPVPMKDLTVSGNIHLEALPGDDSGKFVNLVIDNFGVNNRATVKYSTDGMTFTFPVVIHLPDVGVYSAPQANEANFLPNWAYDGSNDTVYLVGRNGVTFHDVWSNNGNDLTFTPVGGTFEAGVSCVKVQLPAAKLAESELSIGVEGRQYDREDHWDYNLEIDDQRDGLMMRFGDGTVTRFLNGVYSGSWDGEVVYRTGDQFTKVTSFSDLVSDNEALQLSLEENRVRLDAWGEGLFHVSHRKWGGAPITVYIPHLQIGYLGSDEKISAEDFAAADFDTLDAQLQFHGIPQWEYDSSNDVIYLVTNDNFVIEELHTANENRIGCTLSSDKRVARITLKNGVQRDRLEIDLEGYYDHGDGDKNDRRDGRIPEISIRDAEKRLYWVEAEEDQFGWLWQRDGEEPRTQVYASKGDERVGQLFYGVKDELDMSKPLTKDDAARLDLGLGDLADLDWYANYDQNEGEFLKLKVKTWGRGIIRYDSDDDGDFDDDDATMWLFSDLPGVALHSANSAPGSDEARATYLTQWNYKGANDKIYLVLHEYGAKLLNVWVENYDRDFGEYTVDWMDQDEDDRTSCAITLRQPQNDYMRVWAKVRHANREEDEYNCGVQIVDQRAGLLIYDFDFDDHDNLIINDEGFANNYMYFYPEDVAFIFRYRATAGDPWKEVSADDLTVTVDGQPASSDLLNKSGRAEDGHKMVELDISTAALDKDLVFSYQGAAATMEIGLPEVGFYTEPVATEANYAKDWVYDGTDATKSIYVVARGPWCEIEDVGYDYGTYFDVELDEENPQVAKLTIDRVNPNAPRVGVKIAVNWIDERGDYQGSDTFDRRIRIKDSRTQLFVRPAELGAKGYWPDEKGELFNEFHAQPGDRLVAEVLKRTYVNGVATETSLSAQQLTVTALDGGTFKLESEHSDIPGAYAGSFPAIVFNDFGDYTIQEKGVGDGPVIKVHVTLPEIGFYNKPAATKENYCYGGGSVDSGDVIYLVGIHDKIEIMDVYDYDDSVIAVEEYSDEHGPVSNVAKVTILDPKWENFSLKVRYRDEDGEEREDTCSYATWLRYGRVYTDGQSYGNGGVIEVFPGDKFSMGAVSFGLEQAGGQWQACWDASKLPAGVTVTDDNGAYMRGRFGADAMGDSATVTVDKTTAPGEYDMTWYYVDTADNQQVHQHAFTVTLKVSKSINYTAVKDSNAEFGISDVRYQDGDTIYVPVGTQSIHIAPKVSMSLMSDFTVVGWWSKEGEPDFVAIDDDTLVCGNGFTMTSGPVSFFPDDEDLQYSFQGPVVYLPNEVGATLTIEWRLCRGTTTPIGGGADWEHATVLDAFTVTIKMVSADNANANFKAEPQVKKGEATVDANSDGMYFVDLDSTLTLKAVASGDNNAAIYSYQWFRVLFDPSSGAADNEGKVLQRLDGETGDTLSRKIDNSCEYRCQVSDQYGNVTVVPFVIGIENNLDSVKVRSPWALHPDENLSENNPVLVPVGGDAEIYIDCSGLTNPDDLRYYYRWKGEEAVRDYKGDNGIITISCNYVISYRMYNLRMMDGYGNLLFLGPIVVQPDTEFGRMYVEYDTERDGEDENDPPVAVSYGGSDKLTVYQGQTVHVGIVGAEMPKALTDRLEDEDQFYYTVPEIDDLRQQGFDYWFNGDGCFYGAGYDDPDPWKHADEYTPSGPEIQVLGDTKPGEYDIKWFYVRNTDVPTDRDGNPDFGKIRNEDKYGAFTVKMVVEENPAYTVVGGENTHYANHAVIEVPAGTAAISLAPVATVCEQWVHDPNDFLVPSWFTDAKLVDGPDEDWLYTDNGFAMSVGAVRFTADGGTYDGAEIRLPATAGAELNVQWHMVLFSTTPMADQNNRWDQAESLYDFDVTVKVVANTGVNADFDADVDESKTTAAADSENIRYTPLNSKFTMAVKVTGGNPDVPAKYQWYQVIFDPGNDKADNEGKYLVAVNGANDAAYTIDRVTESVEYRCLVDDGYGHGKMIVFFVGVENHFTAKAAKNPVYVHSGERALLELSITADDSSNMQYFWYSGEGENRVDFSSNSATLWVPGANETYGCNVLDRYGNLQFVEDIRVVVVAPVAITAQPADCDSYIDGPASFSLVASGTDLTYQWQYRPAGSNRDEWINIAGADAATYAFTASAALDGRQYRCVVYDAMGLPNISDAATLTVNDHIARGEGWVLDYQGNLTVSNGALLETKPWAANGGKVKTAVLDEGITAVSADAFKGYTALTTVKLPSTVTTIGADAFANANITDVYFNGNDAEWDNVNKNGAGIGSGVTVHTLRNVAAIVQLPGSITVSGEQKVDVSVKLLDASGQEVKPQSTDVDSTGTGAQQQENVFLGGVADGTYTMEVSQKGCVTRAVSVTVAGGDLTVNNGEAVELVKVGNLNGASNANGEETDVTDMACLFDYLKDGIPTGAIADSGDTEYFRAVANVNGDSDVNILDYQALYEMVKAPAGNMADTALVDTSDGWSAYDALIARAKASNGAARVELLHEAEDMLMATYAAIPLYYYPQNLTPATPTDFTYGGTYYIAFNVKSDLFAGKTYQEAALMREAISLAIDRDALCQAINTELNGDDYLRVAANTIVPKYTLDGTGSPGVTFHDAADGYFTTTTTGNDLERARTLLKTVGYEFDGNGKLSSTTPLQFTYLVNHVSGSNAHRVIGELVAQQLSALGIVMTVEEATPTNDQLASWNNFQTSCAAGSFTACRDGWELEVDDPIEILETFTTTNVSNWCQLGR